MQVVIVFVIDNYGEFTNGTTVTAKRSKECLEARGHTVRLVSAGTMEGPEYFNVPKRYIPIVTEASKKQSAYFAKFDKKIMTRAFTGADIIHFFLPFQLTKLGMHLARKMGIPYTAAFHSQPANLTYSMGIGKFGKPIEYLIYKRYLNNIYRKVSRIHCPTTYIANELKRNGYKNDFHVISNGIADYFCRKEKPESEDFKILSIGRYAFEKKQDVLIRAISKSKHMDRIKLVLAGAGPREKYLKKLARKKDIETEFGFFDQPTLLNKIQTSDLYVHAAEAEIEGIACLEAVACGIVPVIAIAKRSATAQFALDERSLFKGGDVAALAERIDYWIEHPDERKEMSLKYEESAKKYRIKHSMDLLEEMFKLEIANHKRELIAKTKTGGKIKKKITFPYRKRVLSFLIYFLIAIPFLWIYLVVIRGVRIKNRKNLKAIQGGAVLVSNHVHSLDSAMSGLASFPKKPVFTGIKENFKASISGFLVSILGTVPIPETILEMNVFFFELKKQAQSGKFVHFFPEGELIRYDKELRPFKRGAFNLAEEAKVPVVPIGIGFKKKKGLFPLMSPNRVIVTIGKPIYPDSFKLKNEAIAQLSQDSFKTMSELIKVETKEKK